jgi:glyoxylase-like metal-dependent hydrolase (beta-lactamase superfamily II)
LAKLGDTAAYGPYQVIKIGDGIYQLNDERGSKTAGGAPAGVDRYLIRGTTKALLIDPGSTGEVTREPGIDATAQLRAVVDGLSGGVPLEVALTHADPDHDGTARVLSGHKIVIWMPVAGDRQAPKAQRDIAPDVYAVFDPAAKTFDLGGGRIVRPLRVRGHIAGCTVYLLTSEPALFTGDCLGGGAGLTLGTATELQQFAQDAQRLVHHIRATLTAYERYALKIHTGHTRANAVAGFVNAAHGEIDVGYLDWRFLQDQALCAGAILRGQWLNPESGLRSRETDQRQTQHEVTLFTYGIGAVELPIAEAYRAAGLKMPQ